MSIVEAVFVTAAAIVTLVTVNAWRRQNIGKRKVELAEDVLMGFYEARDVFAFVRRRLGAPDDGPTQEFDLAPAEVFEARRSQYYGQHDYLRRRAELFGSLEGLRYVFQVYFGDGANGAFEAIADIRSTLDAAGRELFVQPEPVVGEAEKVRERLLDDLGWGHSARPDDMDRAIMAAVATIEDLCKPVLEGRRS
ncbi:MAG TPA: hypothetical protein VHX61_17780 [Rhizomicrobium sp.]|jgi:hypothetical protein|nr:hypothetical protein [Rhizomicrobium sp.]